MRWGGKGTCVLYEKHVPSTLVEYEHHKAIFLFRKPLALLVYMIPSRSDPNPFFPVNKRQILVSILSLCLFWIPIVVE